MSRRTLPHPRGSDRIAVAARAASLLYAGKSNDFYHAKRLASEELGLKSLPSNMEVAAELDKLAQEVEGPDRNHRLIRLRREALSVMEELAVFHPRLIGSVWRGTAHRKSDIDILVFHAQIDAVAETLRRTYPDLKIAKASKTDEGFTEAHYSLLFLTPSGFPVEIGVRSPDEEGIYEKCETYGDLKRGLNLEELATLIEKDPLKRYVPKERIA